MHDSFVFYRSFAEALKELPAEEYKEVMVAITTYALDGELPENLSQIGKAFFTLVKPQVDANNSRREAGRKGGASKAKQDEANSKQTEANGKQTEAKRKQTQAKPKQTEANVNVNVNVNENVNVKEKPSKEGKKKSYSEDPVLDEAMKSYAEHRKSIKSPLTDRAVVLALNKLEELAPGDTPTKVEVINQSIMNGWKGLYPLKTEQRNANRGIERDDEDLDAILLRRVIGG